MRRAPILLVLVAACGHHRPPADAIDDPAAGDLWIYRDLTTGRVRRTSALDTYRLVLDGDRAALEVTTATTDGAIDDPAGWRDTASRAFLGTITVDGDARLLELREAGSELVWRWSCAPHAYDVAPADAVRIASDGSDECGDRGRWSMPVRSTSVLACGDLAGGDPDQLEGIFAFAREPGVEHVVVDDDCVSGDGLRAIARGGAVAPVRAP